MRWIWTCVRVRAGRPGLAQVTHPHSHLAVSGLVVHDLVHVQTGHVWGQARSRGPHPGSVGGVAVRRRALQQAGPSRRRRQSRMKAEGQEGRGGCCLCWGDDHLSSQSVIRCGDRAINSRRWESHAQTNTPPPHTHLRRACPHRVCGRVEGVPESECTTAATAATAVATATAAAAAAAAAAATATAGGGGGGTGADQQDGPG